VVTGLVTYERTNGWYGIVEFNVPLDTIYIISETSLWVRWTNQQCHGTIRRWWVNHISHQAQLTKRFRGCKQKKLLLYT